MEATRCLSMGWKLPRSAIKPDYHSTAIRLPRYGFAGSQPSRNVSFAPQRATTFSRLPSSTTSPSLSRSFAAPACARAELGISEQWSGIEEVDSTGRATTMGANTIIRPKKVFKKGSGVSSPTPVRELVPETRFSKYATSEIELSRCASIDSPGCATTMGANAIIKPKKVFRKGSGISFPIPVREWMPEYRFLKIATFEYELSRYVSINRSLAFEIYDLRVDFLSRSLLHLYPDFHEEVTRPRLSARRKIDQLLNRHEEAERLYSLLKMEAVKASCNLRLIRYDIYSLTNDRDVPPQRREFYARQGFTFTILHARHTKANHHHRASVYQRICLTGVFADAFHVYALLLAHSFTRNIGQPDPYTVMDAFFKVLQTGDKFENYPRVFPVNGALVLRNFYIPMMSKARSAESNMRLRQLDVMALFDLTINSALTIEHEITYLLHTLDQSAGLWSRLGSRSLCYHRFRFKDTIMLFRLNRAMVSKLYKELLIVNWTRLQVEHKLYIMDGVDLNERNRPFTVSKPLSNDIVRFNQWVDSMFANWCKQKILTSAWKILSRDINKVRLQKLDDGVISKNPSVFQWRQKDVEMPSLRYGKNTAEPYRDVRSWYHPDVSSSAPLPAAVAGNSPPRPSTVSSATKSGSVSAFHMTSRSYSSGLNACLVAEHVEENGLRKQLPESLTHVTSETVAEEALRRQQVQTNPDIPTDSTPIFWSHRMHKGPDGKDIVVHYCRTLQSTEEVARHFLDDEVVGFDMEWKAQASSFDSLQNNVSLIQLANEKRIALFHIALFKPATELDHFVSPSLRHIMESPNITKVGVSIKADCTRLRKFLGINPRAIFELSHLHKLVKYCQTTPKLINKRLVNMSEQVEHHFGLPMHKGEDVRCGDWARPLKYEQVQYAASDPFACVCLFNTMDHKRKAIVPMPPRPAHAELDIPIRLVADEEEVTEGDRSSHSY